MTLSSGTGRSFSTSRVRGTTKRSCARCDRGSRNSQRPSGFDVVDVRRIRVTRSSREVAMIDRRTKRDGHAQFLRRELGEIVEELDLEPLQKRFVHDRWLAQLVWFEEKARHNQRLYHALRLVTIAGGVTTAAIVSL